MSCVGDQRFVVFSIFAMALARFIYKYVKSQRVGSMENALWRYDRFIGRRIFVHAVLNEFRFETNFSMRIENHLLAFYDSFDGSEKEQVDWRHILCTYLSLVYARQAFKDPMHFLVQLFDIYSSNEARGALPLCDVLHIISIAAVTPDEFECTFKRVEKCLGGCDDKKKLPVTKEMLYRMFEVSPGILMDYRDQVISRLGEPDRLSLLAKFEGESIAAFENHSNKLMLRRACKILNSSIRKYFSAWKAHTDRKKKHMQNELWMLYWKVKRAMRRWKATVSEIALWRKHLILSKDLYVRSRTKKMFHAWIRYTLCQQKIDRSCKIQSFRFKSMKAGARICRCIFNRLKMRRMFFRWQDEVFLQIKWDYACEWHQARKQLVCFRHYKKITEEGKTCRERNRKATEQQKWLNKMICDIEEEVQRMKAEYLKPRPPPDSKLSEAKARSIQRRRADNMSSDRYALAIQREQRRNRVTAQMEDIVTKWEEKWTEENTLAVSVCHSRASAWVSNPKNKQSLLKLVRECERDFYLSPSIETDKREQMLGSDACICMAIIDGKLAHAGLVPDDLFDKLEQTGKEKLTTYQQFIGTLESFGIAVDSLLVRSLFKPNKVASMDALKRTMLSTYEFLGLEGTLWKKYISPAHQILMYHNVISNEVRW